MPDASQIRAQIPEFAHLNDDQLVDAMQQSYYPQAPREWVADRMGVKLAVPEVESPGIGGRLKDAGISLAKGIIDVPEMGVGLLDIPTGGRIGKMLANEGGSIGFRPAEAKAMLDAGYSPAQKAAFQKVGDARGFMDTAQAVLQNPSTAAQGIVEMAPSLGAGGILGRGAGVAMKAAGAAGDVSTTAGAIGQGVQSAGQNVEQVRQQTPDGTLTAGQTGVLTASGMVDGLLSLIGGKVAHAAGLHDIQTVLAGAEKSPVVRQGLVKSVLYGATQQGLIENLPQSVQNQVAQNYALGKPLDEGVDQAAVMGALTGALVGGGINTLKHGAAPAPEAPPDAPPLQLGHTTPMHFVFPDGSVAVGDAARAAYEQQRFNQSVAPQPGDVPQPPAPPGPGGALPFDPNAGQTFVHPDGTVSTGADAIAARNAAFRPGPAETAAQTVGALPYDRFSGQTFVHPDGSVSTGADAIAARNAAFRPGTDLSQTVAPPATPGDTLRAAAPPVTGITSRAANVAIDTSAQAVDAGAPLDTVPAHPVPVLHEPSAETSQVLLDHAQQRMLALQEAQKGVKEKVIPPSTPEGQPTVIPEVPGRTLTPNEKLELEYYQQHGGDPAAIAHAMGVGPAEDGLIAARAAARAATEAVPTNVPGAARPGDLMTQAGKPYTHRGAANNAHARHPDPSSVDVAPVAGGFVLRPKQQQIELRGGATRDIPEPVGTVRGPDGGARATFATKQQASDYIRAARSGRQNATTMTIEPVPLPDGTWTIATAAERAHIQGIASKITTQGAVAAHGETRAREAAAPPRPDPLIAPGWQAFGPDSGTLHVPRSAMPQVAAEHRGALVNFLKARGIAHSEEMVDPRTLKATQAEFHPEKVKAAAAHTGGDRAILISEDNHLVDGHHQWLGGSGEPVRAIRLHAPIEEVLAHVAQFPSSEFHPDHAERTSAIAEARQRLPGAADKSDDHVLAMRAELRAEDRLVKLTGNHDTGNRIKDEAIRDFGGEGAIRKDQIGWSREFTRRLSAEGDRVEQARSTPGTLENRVAERAAAARRTESNEAMHKASQEEIRLSLDNLREMNRQGRLTDKDFAALQRAQRIDNSFDLAHALHEIETGKSVAQAIRAVKARGDASNEPDDPKTFLRVDETTNKPTLSLETAQKIVSKVTRDWTGAPKIQVVASARDIPEAGVPENAKGLFQSASGDVYVIANQHTSEADLARTLVHESLGHLGLRAAFGGKLSSILDLVARDRPDLLAAKAKDYGFDLNSQSNRQQMAEEVLAEMAEKQPTSGYVARAIAAVRGWLRSSGLAKNLTVSDGEIRSWISQAARAVRRGNTEANARNVGAAWDKTVDVYHQSVAAAARGEADPTTPHLDADGHAMFRLSDTAQHAAEQARDWSVGAGYKVGDFLRAGGTPGKLGLWHKLVGTPYHLAQTNPHFKPVFDAIQSFITDASYHANEAANKARTILPSLESWRDLTKQPLSVEDSRALGSAVFDGTLRYVRDAAGKLAPASSDPEKRAGVVFTDDELKSQFKLNDRQIALYKEFRAATDRGLDSAGQSFLTKFAGKEISPALKQAIMQAPSVRVAHDMLAADLRKTAKANPTRAEAIGETLDHIGQVAARVDQLKMEGYAPLSRFGHYALDVTDPKTGERALFRLFESPTERAKVARHLQESPEFKGMKIEQGTTSDQAYRMYRQISPDTVEAFGHILGLLPAGDSEADKAFQTFLKKAVASTSAMKRMIHREGVEGYSEDPGRVLAGFVYSQGRLTSKNLHGGEIDRGVQDIPKGMGELSDHAIRLREYVQNPQEEAQGLRGLLFAQFLGGSVASAMVNATQPFMTTLPYLSQHGGLTGAGKHMVEALKAAASAKPTGDKALDEALRVAGEKGITAPQEVHQLMAQARGKATLRTGDGTTAGNTLAQARNYGTKLALGWGKVFGVAEQFNRRLTFIAAYNLAREKGIADPAAFAEKAVQETQFLSNKGNKPVVGRGAVGATLFTFKQYSVSYLEMVHRMATAGTAGSPERAAGRRAALYAIGALMLMSGANGLPFIGDVDDAVDGAMQRLGYNFSSKRARESFLKGILGEDLGNFVKDGVSGVPGVPIDVSGRLGMADLIPGTGLLIDKQDHTNDLAQLAGPAGKLVQQAYAGAGALAHGDLAGAGAAVAPQAVQNVLKAADMARTGMYRDQNGKKVIDVDTGDVVSKALGFQPHDVAQVQGAAFDAQKMVAENALKRTQLTQAMAQAEFAHDSDALEKAQADLADWNEKNPDLKITINRTSIRTMLRNMNMTKNERLTKASPAGIRATVKAELAQ